MARLHFPTKQDSGAQEFPVSGEAGQDIIARPNFWLAKLAATGVFVATLVFGVLTGATFDTAISPAAAQSSCQIDFGIMQKNRTAQIAALNKSAKRRKGKLDPGFACKRLRNLAAIERKMVAYMKKNKSWCGIPDQPIEQMTKSSAGTAKMAGRACKAAVTMRRARAQARRQQSQGIAAQRPKLPAGPL